MKFGLGKCIIVIIVFVLLLLYLIKRCGKDRRRACTYIVLGILVFIAFPVLLNAIITKKMYKYIHVQSEMTPQEWFGFWGSYIGSFVAILLGWVAYQQTELSNKQNKQSQEQQEQIAQLMKIVNSLQLKPRITIFSFSMEVYNEPAREYQVRWEIEDLYFTYFGIKKTVEGKRYIVLTYNIINEGISLATNYDINFIKWQIADKEFIIELNQSRHVQITNKMVIIIDEQVKCSESIDKLFDTITMHINYNSHKKVDFDKSVLTLNVQFFNNVASDLCEITCMINSAKIESCSTKVRAVPYIVWGEE